MPRLGGDGLICGCNGRVACLDWLGWVRLLVLAGKNEGALVVLQSRNSPIMPKPGAVGDTFVVL